MDLVPVYAVPNLITRAVRYAALLEDQAPLWCQAIVKKSYTDFVKKMHLVRQQKLEETCWNNNNNIVSQVITANPVHCVHNPRTTSCEDRVVWRVYTDVEDHLELSHPEAGLTSSKFALTDSMEDADIIFSYQSIYTPGELRHFVQQHPNVLINQFPFEGALVQVRVTVVVGCYYLG